jgi:two-component system, LuxR family, response regulator FixJ
MGNHLLVALVDSDFRRRAAISSQLASINFHVEPFEDLEEIRESWPRIGIVLVEDRDSGIRDTILSMTEHYHWSPLVAFSESPDTTDVVRAIYEGAIDYFQWPCSAEQLVHMIGTAEVRGSNIGNLKLRKAEACSRVQKLTKREREVLTCVVGGLSNRLIGEELAISPRTVEIHRANMLTKIGANHTSEAIRIAMDASLVGSVFAGPSVLKLG